MNLMQPVITARSVRTSSSMLAVALSVILSAFACPIQAQGNYPSSPVRMLVGFAPGGTTDIIARALGQKVSTQMNAVVLIENKPGASGNVSAETVAKSKPDGYTLLFMSSGIVLSRAFGEKLGYDILKDLAPAGTPLPITQRLGGEVAKAVRDTAMKSRLQQEGAEPIGSTPEELAAYLKNEVERWGQAAKSAGLKLE